jgi:hypothetical protein
MTMTRALATIVALATLALAGSGCHPGEGERCNPLLFSDECTDGNPNLHCVYPPHCGVAYCCPALQSFTPGTNPNCDACPAGDMGDSD